MCVAVATAVSTDKMTVTQVSVSKVHRDTVFADVLGADSTLIHGAACDVELRFTYATFVR